MTAQLDLTLTRFLGETFDQARDGERLAGLLGRVAEYIADGEWVTLAELAKECGGTEASCSARLRDLRRYGFNIERKFIKRGLWFYRKGA